MKELSIVEEYFLCVLTEKGELPYFSIEASICVIAGGLLDLLDNGCIELDEKKKVIVLNEPGANLSHLESFYQFLVSKKPMTPSMISSEYTFNFSNKNLTAFLECVGHSLAKKGCAEVAVKSGLFGDKVRVFADANEVDCVIQRIRAEILEDGEVSDEVIALVSLLDKSGMLKRYFSKYESEQLKDRLKEIRNSAEHQIVQQMVEYIDTMIAVIAAT